MAPLFLTLQEKLSLDNSVELLELCHHIRRGGAFALFDTASKATDAALTLTKNIASEMESANSMNMHLSNSKKQLTSQ